MLFDKLNEYVLPFFRCTMAVKTCQIGRHDFLLLVGLKIKSSGMHLRSVKQSNIDAIRFFKNAPTIFQSHKGTPYIRIHRKVLDAIKTNLLLFLDIESMTASYGLNEKQHF